MKNNKIKNYILLFVKVIILCLIVYYVILKVQWKDQLAVNVGTQQEKTITGNIKNNWADDVVSFLTEDNESISIDKYSLNQAKEQQLQVGFFTYLKFSNWNWLLLGCLMFLIGLFLNAIRWQILVNVQNISLSFWQALKLNWLGLFFNNFLPGQTGGDVVKAYYVAKHAPDNKTKAVMSVIVDRLLGLSALMFLGMISLTLFNESFQVMAVKLWLLFLLALFFGVLMLNRKFRKILQVQKILPKQPKIIDLWKKTKESIYIYLKSPKVITIAFIISLVSHIITISGIYFFSRAINMGVMLSDFLGLVPIIFLISSIPIAPSGWGIGEALFGNLFSNYASYSSIGFADEPLAKAAMHTKAVAVSILFRLQLMLWSLIGGVFYILHKSDYQVNNEDIKD